MMGLESRRAAGTIDAFFLQGRKRGGLTIKRRLSGRLLPVSRKLKETVTEDSQDFSRKDMMSPS